MVVELREWSRAAQDLAGERTRLANRLRQQLWRYYPQFLELGGDLASAWALTSGNSPPRRNKRAVGARPRSPSC